LVGILVSAAEGWSLTCLNYSGNLMKTASTSSVCTGHPNLNMLLYRLQRLN